MLKLWFSEPIDEIKDVKSFKLNDIDVIITDKEYCDCEVYVIISL